MRKLIIIILLFISTFLNAQEQNTKRDTLKRDVLCGLYVASDCIFLSNNRLNSYLDSKNFYTLKDEVGLGAIGLYYRLKGSPFTNRVFLSHNNNLIFSSGSYTKLNIFIAGIECAYDLLNESIWNVEPYAGIMIVNNSMMAVSKKKRSDLSGNPLEEVFQSRGIFVINLGLQLSRTFKLRNCNLKAGLRGAYNVDIFRNSWFNNSYQYSCNLPKLSFSAFTAGVIIQVDCDINSLVNK